MPAINIGDVQVIVQTVQQTQPSLKIMGSDGIVYYADANPGACPRSLVVGDADNPYTIGKSTLVYEATSFDVCETVSLPAGCYSVSIMGGVVAMVVIRPAQVVIQVSRPSVLI